MDLAKLNEIAGYMSTLKIVDLEVGRKYMVTSMKKVTTRYGLKTVAVLDEQFQVYLPNRVSKAFEENEEFFNSMCDTANQLKLFLIRKTPDNNGNIVFETL